MRAGTILMVEHALEIGAVMRVVIHSPTLGRGVTESDNAKLVAMLRFQIKGIAQALIIDGNGQMVDDGERAPGLRHPQQSVVRTVNGVVSVAEQTQSQLQNQTNREKGSNRFKEPVFLVTHFSDYSSRI